MSQVIPEAAVEAAARAMHAQENAREDVGEFSLWVYERDVREILEAAGPHIERALTGRLLEAGWQEPEKPYIA